MFIKTGTQIHSKAYQLDSGPVVIDVMDNSSIHSVDEPQIAGRISVPQHLDLLWKNRLSSGNIERMDHTTSSEIAHLQENSTRISAAERQLLDSLSRAASQGVIFVDPKRQIPKEATGASLKDDLVALVQSDGTASSIPVQSETVFERDLELANDRSKILINGQSCPSDQNYAVETWITESPLGDQLTDARNGLIGEFDRPDPSAVERLARLYVALGFGVEAKATLAAFGFNEPSKQSLIYLADVIDGIPTPPESPISRMGACNGKVALWAFVGGPLPYDAGQIDLNSVQSTFSALPAHIRDTLGPILVNRLLKIGQTNAAEAVRNALQRSSSAQNSSLAITQAQLLLASGQPQAAEDSLTATESRNDLNSASRLVLSIDARLMRDQSIDRETTEDVAAQLHQNGDSDLGQKLRRALVLSQGSIGDFDQAFETLSDWPSSDHTDQQDKTLSELFGQLSRVPDDVIYAKQIFKRGEALRQANLSPSLRIALADRISALGFSATADELLTPEIRETVAGRLALARAAVAEKDGAAALTHLSGLDGDAATQLRALAYLALGEHSNAAELYQVLGDEESSAREAWRGASWEIVRDHGSEIERAVIAAPAQIATNETTGPVPAGPITRANSLITQSQDERALLNRLLTSY